RREHDPINTIKQALRNNWFEENSSWPEGMSGGYEEQVMQYPEVGVSGSHSADGFQLTIPYHMMHFTVNPASTTVSPTIPPEIDVAGNQFQFQLGESQVYIDD